MGSDYSVSHAAVLASQLPPHSRCTIAQDPNAAWSEERTILEAIDYHIRHLMWMFSEDGSKKINRPEPPVMPSEIAQKQKVQSDYLKTKQKVDRILGITS